MRVLLTGANGFVGSHILDLLLDQAIPVTVLLRPGARTGLIEPHLRRVRLCRGSVTDPGTLPAALEGASHVIHCAGRTKVLHASEYYETNETGTRHLVRAIRQAAGAVQRLVLMSSLAASRPGVASAPAREDDLPAPVSDYGRSKLAGEQAVRQECSVPYVILRPSAVYGPRDSDFLHLFKAVRAGVLPRFGGGGQPLSLAFAPDLAAATLAGLQHPAAPGRTYNVAGTEVVTPAHLAQIIAEALGRRVWPLPMPAWGLWCLCVVQEIASRLSGRPGILSRGKYREARAAGWVCDVSRLRQELGFECRTGVREGVVRTLSWYREQGWLRGG